MGIFLTFQCYNNVLGVRIAGKRAENGPEMVGKLKGCSWLELRFGQDLGVGMPKLLAYLGNGGTLGTLICKNTDESRIFWPRGANDTPLRSLGR